MEYKLAIKLEKTYRAIYLVLLLLCTNCIHSVQKIKENGIREVNIISNLSKSSKINLSEVASSIDYCLLENDEKCLVTPQMSIYCSKNYIITIGNQYGNHDVCYIFERKSGNFIRQISSIGQGPGEYTEAVASFWDEDKEQVCLWGNNQYLFFNIDGTLSHQTNRFPINSCIKYNDFYVGYMTNSRGNTTIRVAFYDKTGVLIDSIPNYRVWEKKDKPLLVRDISQDGRLFVFQGNLYYKDIYCDTLYQVKDFEFQPRFIFNTGGLAVPYEIQEGGRYNILRQRDEEYDRYEKYIIILNLLEDNKHLYFTVEHRQQLYPAIYNKAKGKLQIMLPVSIPEFNKDWRMPLHGFENDLDGGLPFWPQQMISDKEMMCVYTAEELRSLDVSKITNEKLKNVLKSLDEESNPIIAFVTLKD